MERKRDSTRDLQLSKQLGKRQLQSYIQPGVCLTHKGLKKTQGRETVAVAQGLRCNTYCIKSLAPEPEESVWVYLPLQTELLLARDMREGNLTN